MSGFEAIVAGGGPAGLSAAEAIASRGRSVLILEQNHEIGSPIRTSGGSFVSEMQALGIPSQLYHPIYRVRFVAPHNAAVFDYDVPALCVMDVRGVFQYLAERAIGAGAHLQLSTAAVAPVMDGDAVTGVRTKTSTLSTRVLIDATGYRSSLFKPTRFRRFGVGAEYDLFAPHCDQTEAILVVGNDFAPSGYGWVFPWGRGRVRVGVGIIHPDSAANPDLYLDRFLEALPRYGVNTKGAQPVEHHTGLIPSERFASTFAGNGILAVGDAAGQASSLLGEGIRWAIQAGQIAGEVVAQALSQDGASKTLPRTALLPFEQKWRRRFGADLRLAHRINQRIARWDDRKWDERTEIIKLLSPEQFAEALKTNLTGGWLWRFLVSHPKALAGAARLENAMEQDQPVNESGLEDALVAPVNDDAQFFWDPAVFRVLTNQVLPRLLRERSLEDPIRIWVPGCSTGEDVYSIGIALFECLRDRSISIPVTIFGSDLHDSRLRQARAAVYSENIARDVSPELLARYFTTALSGYQISRGLREHCIFAHQDLTRDAPFSKVDLISCRNVLSHLGAPQQRKAAENLRYALKSGGHLLIGAGEHLPADLFRSIDPDNRLFSKTLHPSPPKDLRGVPAKPPETHIQNNLQDNPDVAREADRIVLGRYAPAGIVVNADLKILQCRGQVGRFLEIDAGGPGLKARKGLVRALRTSLDRAKKWNEPVRREGLRIRHRSSPITVALEVIPFRKPAFPEPYFLVLFDVTASDLPKHTGRGRHGSDVELRGVRREMAAVKQRLESTIDELQLHIEELTSANTEVQYGNEELQSLNEELEAARAELQSANQSLEKFNRALSKDNLQLIESNDDLSNLLSSVELPVVIVDEHLCLRRFTPAAGRLLNLVATDVGRSILDFKPRIEVPDLEELLRDVFDNLRVVEREVRGEQGRSYSMSVRPYRTRENRIEGALMVIADITELKHSLTLRPPVDNVLQESQAFSEFLRQVPVGILWSDTEGQCSFANAEACRVAGVTPLEALGRGWTKHVYPDDLPLLSRETRLEHGEKYSHDIRFQFANGATVWAHRVSMRMHRQDGAVEGYFSTISDITEQKNLEEQLTQANKMEAIGRLAGGIAHDFNNLLTAISGYAAELLSALPASHPGRKAAEQIGKVGDQAGMLTKQLLAVSRKQVVRPRHVNLNDILRDMHELLKRLLGETIEISYEFEPELGTAVLDPGQAQQVILNLAINARDAMAHGGRLTLSTSNVLMDVLDARKEDLSPGAYVGLTATDAGAGMGQATRERAFEPFFTTKPPGYGTGLGLSMVYGIVQNSGGSIRLESEVGKGTTVRILFPRSGEAFEPAVQEIHKTIPGGHETILLVEDSGVVRSLVRQVLAHRGYTVIEASDGAEALSISDKHKGPIHLLLTDLLMPRMGGDQLGKRIRRRRPRIKIIYMSGYSGEAFHAVKKEANFLEKPFKPEQLAEAIRKVLDE